MAKPRLLRIEGIVIKHVDFGEADKLLTLYTRHLGKVAALAKGVRRPTSRLGGHVEIFTHSQFLLAKGRNLDVVTQAETLHPFINLRADLERTGYACYVAEVHDRLTPDRMENQAAYDLLLETLQRLDGGTGAKMAVHLFEMRLLGHLGYQPQLFRCLLCEKVLGPTGNFFSPVVGGALCSDCGHDQVGARTMTVNGFKVLRLLQGDDGNRACRLRLDEELDRELDAIMHGQISYVLEGELRSVGVLRSMNKGHLGRR